VKSSVTREFRLRFRQLPRDVQRRARQAYRLWRGDPAHPGLHFKQLSKRQPVYSVRIGIGYRALALRDSLGWVWFWIGTHAEYDALLKRL